MKKKKRDISGSSVEGKKKDITGHLKPEKGIGSVYN
jgi:hypothetical protein